MISVANILPSGWVSVFSAEHPQIAIGIDPATTTKKTSNPTSITVTQRIGLLCYERLVIRLKTGDPDVIEELMKTILDGLRAVGLSVRKLIVLATSERFWAIGMRKRLASRVPVELLIESEKIKYLGAELLVKAYLGNLFVNTIDDGYLPLPAEDWLKTDLRLVLRDRGTFDSEIGPDGGHGDCFASGGAALHGLISAGGSAEAEAGRIGNFSNPAGNGRKMLNPDAHKFRRGGETRVAT
jgi:hypothetical protein